jgi:hypothetical protein
MSGVEGIIRIAAVVIMFGFILYAGYYMSGQYDLPSFVTDLMPPGSVVNWNDKVLIFPDVTHSAGMWQGSQVLAGEMEATQWVRDHTLKTDKFVADIGGAEAIMGMTTRVSLVGGDWANAADPVRNMELAGQIYGSNTNASRAHDLALDAGCSFVWLPNRQLNTGTFNSYADASKFEDPDYFQLVYKNDDVSIYRVLP